MECGRTKLVGVLLYKEPKVPLSIGISLRFNSGSTQNPSTSDFIALSAFSGGRPLSLRDAAFGSLQQVIVA